jgi:cold shock protein
MTTGTVRWFNSQKGFGFIRPDAGGKDIFVDAHAMWISGIASLSEGQKLAFEERVSLQSGKSAAAKLQRI